jgi:MFS family permease
LQLIQYLKLDKENQKLAFWLAAYAFAATMVGTTLPTPLYPIYRSQMGLSELMITIIYATYAAGVIAALLAFGEWSDQIGRRPLLFGGLVLSAVSAIFFLAGASLPTILAGRIFSGLSAGVFTGTATAMVVELGAKAGNNHSTMVATGVNMGGLGIGPLLAGLLAQYAPLPLHLSFVVDLALIALGFFAIWYTPETVDIPDHPRLRLQRLSLPPQVRGVFLPAAIAGFAGFAVFGFFTGVVPAVMGNILHISSHAILGTIVFVLFMASVAGQFMQRWMGAERAMVSGCLILIVAVGLIYVGISFTSLAPIVAGAVVSGFGQGLIFRAGIEEITDASPEGQRGEITSTFFVVLYVAISIPIIGIGLMNRAFGLRTAGVDFAIGVMALTFIALLALLYHFKNDD